ncbi:uncharacterized protein SCHCODRAFT_02644836 [Schizophyllum commune H4-8]|nr:uncharacterized protein SCHCODRAFT_02644836 [Schizophyllum commune H4-8]KAI5885015.1 hypothetical protein SCHCODRAFT_02644836 [Schizophyllum commune H4-8]
MTIEMNGQDIGGEERVASPEVSDSVGMGHTGAVLSCQSYPDDVLFEIFAFACSTSEITASTSTPMALSHVSRSWRAVALSYPVLWSGIRILSSADHNWTDPEGLARLLKLYLARSCSAPLDICYLSGTFAVDFKAIIHSLLPHSTRWRSILTRTRTLPALLAARGRLPLLKSVRIIDEQFEGCSEALDVLACSPRLTRWDSEYTRTEQLALPWAQLTDLDFTVDGEYPLWLTSLAPRMASLRRVAVRIKNTPPYLHIWSLVEKGSIVWPASLEEIRVVCTRTDPDFIMHGSTFSPNLRVLSVEVRPHTFQYQSGVSGWRSDSFVDLAERSGFRQGLRVLRLRNIRLQKLDFVRIQMAAQRVSLEL